MILPIEFQKDNAPYSPEVLALIREKLPSMIAEEILSVQPMDPTLGKQLIDGGMNEADLIAGSYQPVSNHRLMWIKE